tara:strand:- start:54 stop:263 length:210 start_codon:yes stop_codon:yes gene_type:complete
MDDQFFKLKKNEFLFIVGNLVYAIIVFHPFWSDKIVWGVSMTGWLLVLFMIISPLLALLIFYQSHRSTK